MVGAMEGQGARRCLVPTLVNAIKIEERIYSRLACYQLLITFYASGTMLSTLQQLSA